jgi:hypothetical protein
MQQKKTGGQFTTFTASRMSSLRKFLELLLSFVEQEFSQVDPHLCKEECDRFVREGLVYGCGKPFKIIDKIAVKCDYI